MYTYTDYCEDRAEILNQYVEGRLNWFEARLVMSKLFRRYQSRPLPVR